MKEKKEEEEQEERIWLRFNIYLVESNWLFARIHKPMPSAAIVIDVAVLIVATAINHANLRSPC